MSPREYIYDSDFYDEPYDKANDRQSERDEYDILFGEKKPSRQSPRKAAPKSAANESTDEFLNDIENDGEFDGQFEDGGDGDGDESIDESIYYDDFYDDEFYDDGYIPPNYAASENYAAYAAMQGGMLPPAYGGYVNPYIYQPAAIYPPGMGIYPPAFIEGGYLSGGNYHGEDGYSEPSAPNNPFAPPAPSAPSPSSSHSRAGGHTPPPRGGYRPVEGMRFGGQNPRNAGNRASRRGGVGGADVGGGAGAGGGQSGRISRRPNLHEYSTIDSDFRGDGLSRRTGSSFGISVPDSGEGHTAMSGEEMDRFRFERRKMGCFRKIVIFLVIFLFLVINVFVWGNILGYNPLRYLLELDFWSRNTSATDLSGSDLSGGDLSGSDMYGNDADYSSSVAEGEGTGAVG
jgi:hypothetical protein